MTGWDPGTADFSGNNLTLRNFKANIIVKLLQS